MGLIARAFLGGSHQSEVLGKQVDQVDGFHLVELPQGQTRTDTGHRGKAWLRAARLACQAVWVTLTSTAFTPAGATELAHEAAARVRLAHESIELIRMGSTAVLRLPGGVVARVARDMSWSETSKREVRVAAVLDRAGVPCTVPCRVDQPVVVDEHPITFWAEIPGPLQDPTLAQLGAVLRRLHQVDLQRADAGLVDADLGLPQLDPWARTPERIEQAPIADGDRRVLRGVLAEVQDAWAGVRFALDAGVIHGDAYLGNLVCGADGTAVLLDFDSVCDGPREWDLVPTALYATSLGWISRAEYSMFVEAYGGFDVTTSPAYPLLARMRELRMTAWIAMHATESDRVAAEVAHRVACLADPQLPRQPPKRDEDADTGSATYLTRRNI